MKLVVIFVMGAVLLGSGKYAPVTFPFMGHLLPLGLVTSFSNLCICSNSSSDSLPEP